jgi:hypothetical protein
MARKVHNEAILRFESTDEIAEFAHDRAARCLGVVELIDMILLEAISLQEYIPKGLRISYRIVQFL